MSMKILQKLKFFLFGRDIRVQTVDGFYTDIRGVRREVYHQESVYVGTELVQSITLVTFKGLLGKRIGSFRLDQILSCGNVP